MRAAVLSALLVPVFLTGCSTYVTVVSEPEGAVITDASGSIVYGRAPLDVEYDTNELKMCIRDRPSTGGTGRRAFSCG